MSLSDGDLPDADPALEQYFLTAPAKISLLMNAAGITPLDHVVEVGAGVGTVASEVPPCAGLTLVELDERLAAVLRRRVPGARVVHGDALAVLPTLQCDVLLSNLPSAVTESLLRALPGLSCRTAVLAVGAGVQLDAIDPELLDAELIGVLDEGDFLPRQPVPSRLLRVNRRR